MDPIKIPDGDGTMAKGVVNLLGITYDLGHRFHIAIAGQISRLQGLAPYRNVTQPRRSIVNFEIFKALFCGVSLVRKVPRLNACRSNFQGPRRGRQQRAHTRRAAEPSGSHLQLLQPQSCDPTVLARATEYNA